MPPWSGLRPRLVREGHGSELTDPDCRPISSAIRRPLFSLVRGHGIGSDLSQPPRNRVSSWGWHPNLVEQTALVSMVGAAAA